MDVQYDVCLLKELSHGWNRESYRVTGTPDFTTPDSHCQYDVCLLKELSHGWNRESYRVTGTPDFKRRSAMSMSVFRPTEISALEIAAEQVSIIRSALHGLK